MFASQSPDLNFEFSQSGSGETQRSEFFTTVKDIDQTGFIRKRILHRLKPNSLQSFGMKIYTKN